MQPVRSRAFAAPSSLDGAGGWLLAAALAVYVIWVGRGTTLGPLPYWPAWIAAVAAALSVAVLAVRRLRPAEPRLRPVEALAAAVVVGMVLTDLAMAWQPLRDLGIYLKAGEHYLAGTPVYLQHPMTAGPADLSNYPFLYPPITLPFFALLSLLPGPLAGAVWIGASVALVVPALRMFGLPTRWALAALLWPPLFQGLWVGNIAVPALVLFAAGPWLGAGLVFGAVFKAYTGIGGLWLARERRWLDIVVGAGALLLLAALMLPLVGLGLWSDWLEGLRQYGDSQRLLPALYGFGLARYMPLAVFIALAVAAVLAAFRARGWESLARFGVATVIASPSLFGHGFLVVVPAMLALRTPWMWLALGVISAPYGPQWWPAIGIVAAAWVLPGLRRSSTEAAGADDPLHPLPADRHPWPDAPFGEPPPLGLGFPAPRPAGAVDGPEPALAVRHDRTARLHGKPRWIRGGIR